MQQPLACKEALANMHGRFSAESVEAPELLLGLSKYAFGTIVGMTRLCCPALPSWQQWRKLDRACFWKTDATILAAMGEAPWWMLLGTRRYHLGRSGGNSIVHASRKPMVPYWLRWGKLHGGCF